MLELHDVAFAYPGQDNLFSGISLELRSNEVVGLIGRSGVGKTTLLRLMAGLSNPTSGTVCFGGVPLTAPTPDIGLMFQNYALFDWYTAIDNVTVAMRMANKNCGSAEYYLTLVGLENAMKRYPRELSGGMRQRLALARAIAVGPRILLLDEPFAALDVNTRAAIVSSTFSHIRELNLSALVVTHDVTSVIAHCDRVMVLKGSPVKLGTPNGIASNLAEERKRISNATAFHAEVVAKINREIMGQSWEGERR